jgi:hypothetical protein
MKQLRNTCVYVRSEDGSNKSPRNVGKHVQDYTALLSTQYSTDTGQQRQLLHSQPHKYLHLIELAALSAHEDIIYNLT